MIEHDDSTKVSTDLRERAEALLSQRISKSEGISAPPDIQRLVHELQIHQIELEMQNEELRRAQCKLEELKDRYLDLYDFAPVGYVTLNDKGFILEANLTAVRLLGVERQRLTKMLFSRFVARGLRGTYYSHLQQVFETQSEQTCEIKLARNDGTGFFAQLETVPVQDETGQINRCRTVFLDITERREAQEALWAAKDNLEARVQERTADLEEANRILQQEMAERRRAEAATKTERQRLYDILETMPIIVCLLTPDHRVAFANRSFREKFGEDTDRHCFDLVFGSKEPCEFCEAYNVLKTGEPHHWEVTGPDGSIFDVYHSPFTDADGSPLILELDIDITERKEAEKLREKALETAEIITKMFSTTHFCIAFLDRDLNFFRVNQAYADTCGYPLDFFPGKNHFDLYPHEENETIFRRVVETGETFTVYAKPFEFPDDPDRGVTYWDWTLHPVKDSEGNVEGLIFVLLEVTERKRAEEALLAAGAYNRRLIEASLDPLVTISAQGKITDVNTATEKVTGLSAQELIGADFADYFTDPEKARSVYEQVFQDGVVKNYELEIRHNSGGRTPVMYNASLYRDENGKVVGVFAAARDISDRKRAEEDLIRSNELLKEEIAERTKAENDRDRLFNLSIDMLCVAGFDGFFKQTNPAFGKILGWSQEELLCKPWVEFVHPDDREKTAFARGQLVDGTIVHSFENRYKCKDGSYRWLSWSAFPLVEEKLIVGVARDVTERKRMEEELIRSNQDLQQFAYVASHDLQEPLRNVVGCLQMLEKKYKSKLEADADKYIDYAVEGALRMRALIQGLLAYSRVATTRKPLQQVDCAQILAQTVKNLASTISEAGALITHGPLPTIQGDVTQLLLVFQNLIQNAIKFRKDEPPRAHVSASKRKNEWIFSVKDNGIGIESEYLDRIFVIFQRLHKRSRYDGTGMGLAIVKRIIEHHGGRIWAESELGAGSTFYFTMPMRKVAKP